MNKREYIIAGTLAVLGSEHDFDPETLVAKLGEMYDLIPAGETVDEDGWQDWAGQKPYPKGQVDVMFRDGGGHCNQDADLWTWDHCGVADDIVKWRPAR